MSGPRGGTFDVWPTPIGSEDLRKLRGDVARAAQRSLKSLRSAGCRAANYRLSGAEVDRICVVTLPRTYRLLIAFPAEQEVVVLLAGRHDETNPAIDVYSRLYRGLGIEAPSDDRDKPECCEKGQPLVDAQLIDRFIAGTRELERDQRRRHRARLDALS